MPRFRLLHFSDLHLGFLKNQNNKHEVFFDKLLGRVSDVTWKDLAANPKAVYKPSTYSDYAPLRFALFCEGMQDEFDAAVVTGDLACTGHDRDMTPAVDYFTKSVGKNFVQTDQVNTLASIRRPIYVMPGNHDRYQNSLPFPGPENFESKFKDIYDGPKVYSFTRLKEDKRIGVVFGDFCIEEFYQVPVYKLGNLYGQGIAHGHVIEEMVNETLDLRKSFPGILIIWAIHFAPFVCDASLYFRDHSKFIKSAKKNGVKVVLCGHTHDRKKITDDDITIYCAGSVMCADRENSHQVHIVDIQFDDDELKLERENFTLYRNSHTFVRTSTD